ncbi:MAG: sigma-70 family RNA polymerase sigma factor [Vicinamibacterales bacterium]
MTAAAERALVDRCRGGDQQAFRELVDQYKGLVYAIVLRTLGDPARAEDVAQDVFLRVYRGLPYFRGDAKLSTWIYRIAVNAVTAERRPPPSEPLEGTGEVPREFGVEDRRFNDLALRDRVEKALQRLPPHYRLLINGHYMKGLRYEDLAEALDLPLGTVKTHLHRAKRQLRHLLDTEYR